MFTHPKLRDHLIFYLSNLMLQHVFLNTPPSHFPKHICSYPSCYTGPQLNGVVYIRECRGAMHRMPLPGWLRSALMRDEFRWEYAFACNRSLWCERHSTAEASGRIPSAPRCYPKRICVLNGYCSINGFGEESGWHSLENDQNNCYLSLHFHNLIT